MAELSMLEIAYTILSKSKKEMAFIDLWKEVVKEDNLTEEQQKARLGRFYTDLSLDGRFVALTDNTWDLRTRHKYEQVHIDVQDVYSDVEEGDEDEEDAEEEKEYNAAVEGKAVPEEEAATESEGAEVKPEATDPAALLGIKKEDNSY